jgi:hypothetical protein
MLRTVNCCGSTRPRSREHGPPNRASVAPDDLGAAVREEGAADARRGAPLQLRPNRGVADRPSLPAPHDRAPHRRPVADIEVEPGKRLLLVDDRDEIGRVRDRTAAGADAVADCGRSQRMLDRERLKRDPQHRQRPARLEDPALGDRMAVDRAPVRRRTHRTGRPVAKTRRVIGMRVREHDCGRPDARQTIQSAPQSTMSSRR